MSHKIKRIVVCLVPKDLQHHYTRLLKYPKEALAANLAVSFPGPSYALMDSIDAVLRAHRAHELNDWLAANRDRFRKIFKAGVRTRAQVAFIQKFARVERQFAALIAQIERPRRMKKGSPS